MAALCSPAAGERGLERWAVMRSFSQSCLRLPLAAEGVNIAADGPDAGAADSAVSMGVGQAPGGVGSSRNALDGTPEISTFGLRCWRLPGGEGVEGNSSDLLQSARLAQEGRLSRTS